MVDNVKHKLIDKINSKLQPVVDYISHTGTSEIKVSLLRYMHNYCNDKISISKNW